MTRAEVIDALERKEVPYIGWHRDWPDLYDDYFRRLSPRQQEIANFFNGMDASDFELYKQSQRWVNRIP